MLQNLYRLLSIYSNGYILKEVVFLKIAIGLLFISLTFYGAVANFALFLAAFSVFGLDYLTYRAYMFERFYRVEEYARRFNIQKLLDAEGAYRPIFEHQLKNPPYTEETEYILESIRNESLGETNFALDIGCGSGVLTVGALKIGIRTVSLDVTLRSLKFTAEFAKRNGYRTERVLADAQYLPFRDLCFHVVVASSVIEHLPSDIMGFKEAARVLKHRGKAIFSFPSHHSPVFSLYSFLFNPIILVERLISWKLPSILPKRSKFVYLSELFLTRNRVFFDDVSIHRLYDQKTLKNLLKELGLSVKLIGSLSARGGKLSLGRLRNLVIEHPCFAHVFIVFGVKQGRRSKSHGNEIKSFDVEV